MNRINVIKRIFGSRVELEESNVIVNNKRAGKINDFDIIQEKEITIMRNDRLDEDGG